MAQKDDIGDMTKNNWGFYDGITDTRSTMSTTPSSLSLDHNGNVPYSNFHSGEPNNGGTASTLEYVVQVNWGNPLYEWNDLAAKEHWIHGYFVEFSVYDGGVEEGAFENIIHDLVLIEMADLPTISDEEPAELDGYLPTPEVDYEEHEDDEMELDGYLPTPEADYEESVDDEMGLDGNLLMPEVDYEESIDDEMGLDGNLPTPEVEYEKSIDEEVGLDGNVSTPEVEYEESIDEEVGLDGNVSTPEVEYEESVDEEVELDGNVPTPEVEDEESVDEEVGLDGNVPTPEVSPEISPEKEDTSDDEDSKTNNTTSLEKELTELGLSQSEIDIVIQTGLTVDEVTKIIELNLQITELKKALDLGFSLSDIETIIKVGLDIEDIEKLMTQGLDLEKVEQMFDIGISKEVIEKAIEVNLEIEDIQIMMQRGLSPQEIIRIAQFCTMGLEISDIENVLDYGFSAQEIISIIELDLPEDIIREIIEMELDQADIERILACNFHMDIMEQILAIGFADEDLGIYIHEPYIYGYPEDVFIDTNNLSRAEVIAITARLLDEQIDETKVYPTTFIDVPTDAWYANTVGYIEQKGLINGYGDGTLKPDMPITRAEFIALVSNLNNTNTGSTSNNSFKDIDTTHWASDVISRATSNGWIDGYSDNTFRPDEPITRDEAVSVVNKIIDRRIDIDNIYSDGLIIFEDMYIEHWAYYDVLSASNRYIDLSVFK